MRKMLTSAADLAWRVSRLVCLVAMIILTPVVFANIVLRFFWGYSLGWSSEVARYAFVWLTFMGTATALRDNSHAKIELIIKLAPRTWQKYIKILACVLIALLSLFLIVSGILQTIKVWDVSAAYMRFLSMSWMYLAIPLSGLFMLIFMIENIVILCQEGEKKLAREDMSCLLP